MERPEGWTFDMRPCPHCGKMITQVSTRCRFCKGAVEAAVEGGDLDDDLNPMLLPVGRPASAIAAGYLGLFSLLPVFGVVAIIVSLFALRTLNRNPKLRGRGRAIFGLVMGVLTTLLYGLPFIALLLSKGQ